MSAPMGYPQTPVVAKPKPGIGGIIIGAALMVLGFGIGLALILGAAVSSAAPVMNAKAYNLGATAQVQLNAGDQEGVWVTGEPVSGFVITDSSGNQMPCMPSGMNTHVNEYNLFCSFTAETAGQYSITANAGNAGTPTMFKVAPAVKVGGLVGGIVGGILLMILLPLIGLIVLIVSIVRRSNWTRDNTAHMVQPEMYLLHQAPNPQPHPVPWPHDGLAPPMRSRVT